MANSLLKEKFAIFRCFSFLLVIVLVYESSPWAFATRLPAEIRKTVLSIYENGNVRLDGSLSLPDGNFLLPVVPSTVALNPFNTLRKFKLETTQKFPVDSKEPSLIFYDNGWAHIRTIRKGKYLTFVLPKNLSEQQKKKILSLHFPSDLIVPEGLVLPKSLKSIAGEVAVPLVDDSKLVQEDFGKSKSLKDKNDYQGSGTLAFISVSHGVIILVDAKNYNKLAEFPTEGTPWGMTFVNNKLFITDQAKSRVLILDPVLRKFLGQIDLADKTAPRGIASLPNGKLFYVAQSGTRNLAVIESDSSKVLVQTKLPIGPGRVAMTADGVYLVVISVTASELSVISTYNQQLIGSVKLGNVPTAVVLHPKEKIAYVSNRMSNTISIIDIAKRTLLNSINTGNSPTGLAISSDGSKLFVALGRDNVIVVYNTETLEKLQEIKLPLDIDFPGSIALSPDAKYLYITSQQTDTVGVLDLSNYEFKKQIQLGHPTQDVLWIPAG